MKVQAFSLTLPLLARLVCGAPTNSSSTTAEDTSTSIPVPSNTVAPTAALSTAVPSPSATAGALNTFPAPQNQTWCQNPIYCAGEILQTVQLAELYTDQKTFVDKPTSKPLEEVVSAFNDLVQNNYTIEGLVAWIDENFKGEGLDIEAANLTDWIAEPDFLKSVEERTLQGWLKQVHAIWKQLARQNVQNQTCSTCSTSLIPLNHTFIVPGGRFREAYYWDTFWVLQGLLTSGLHDTSKSIITNFMDLIRTYGFIPNGGRIYYLDRSQPPLYTQMLWSYINATNDTSFLQDAVDLSDKEMQWWDNNRSISVTGPSGKNHTTHRYAVDVTAPRPESYGQDWETVNGPLTDPTLNLSIDLYSDLASGAESGMDYSASRWTKNPTANLSDSLAPLRTINTNEQIPVDLESILHRNYVLLAQMYDMLGNSSRKDYWNSRAADSKAAVLDLHWDNQSMTFRDYNLTANALANIWSTVAYYPYWSDIIPDEVLASEENAQKAFSGLGYITSNYNGSIPTTLIQTGNQWDFPNVWPPQVWIAVEALKALPENVTTSGFSTYGNNVTAFDYLPPNHFGLSKEQLPTQSILGTTSTNLTNVTTYDQLGNVGNLTDESITWRDGLATSIVSRYMSAAFCSWYSTGGSVPGLLDQLSEQDLNLTNSVGNIGNMFEKFSALDLDQAGAGGEYTVVAGFGWTNGVAIAWGKEFGNLLSKPDCPAIAAEASSDGAESMHRVLELRPELSKNVLSA